MRRSPFPALVLAALPLVALLSSCEDVSDPGDAPSTLSLTVDGRAYSLRWSEDRTAFEVWHNLSWGGSLASFEIDAFDRAGYMKFRFDFAEGQLPSAGVPYTERDGQADQFWSPGGLEEYSSGAAEHISNLSLTFTEVSAARVSGSGGFHMAVGDLPAQRYDFEFDLRGSKLIAEYSGDGPDDGGDDGGSGGDGGDGGGDPAGAGYLKIYMAYTNEQVAVYVNGAYQGTLSYNYAAGYPQHCRSPTKEGLNGTYYALLLEVPPGSYTVRGVAGDGEVVTVTKSVAADACQPIPLLFPW